MKPRILIVSPVTPYPVFHGAGSAIFGYLRALRREFDILFCGFCPAKLLGQAEEGLRMLCKDVYLAAPPERRTVDALDRTPFYFSNLKHEGLRQAVREMHRKYRPDIVQVEYMSMAEYAEGLDGVRLMRAHVQEWWHFYLGFRNCLSPAERFTKMLGAFDTIVHNRKTLETFDCVLVTHEEERKHALELVPNARVEALPFLLMDCEQFEPWPHIPTEPRLIFVGYLPHTPNEEGLRWFLENAYPHVLKEEPTAQLVVVGGGPSNRIRGLMHDCDVEYHGFVEDLRSEYARARVYLAPIFSGGGIRTKIIEAMTAGVPVVSTVFGPLGIGTVAGEHLLAADDPREYADAVVRLIREDATWWRIRNRARAFVEESYSLQTNGPSVARRYQQYLSECAA